MVRVPDEAAAGYRVLVAAAAGRTTNNVVQARITEVVVGEWGYEVIHKDSWPHRKLPATVIVCRCLELDAICS